MPMLAGPESAVMDPTSAGMDERRALTQGDESGSEAAAAPEPEYQYYYEKHGGHMRFCCKGRCMVGPRIDNEYVAFAWVAILAPSAVYYLWAAPVVWEHWGPKLPLSAASMLVATLVTMLATMFTDPGFIMKHGQPAPRNPPTDWRTPVYKHIRTEIGTYPFMWCSTCKLWRPPYSHHCVYGHFRQSCGSLCTSVASARRPNSFCRRCRECRDCGHCVLGFDHHCPFVNNCIGVRNRFYFVAFISCVSALGVLTLIGTGSAMYIHMQQQQEGGEDVALFFSPLFTGDKQMYILMAMAFPTTILTIVLILFVLFHTVYLPCCGQEGYMKDGLVSCLSKFGERLLCGCCRNNTDYRQIEAGAPAGTKAFCNRNKPKKQMTLDSPTGDSRQSAEVAETPPTPQEKKDGSATVSGAAPPATPARHAQHPKKSAVGASGATMRADDGGSLSGVVGWELSDGKVMRLCMPKLMQPRRKVLKEPPADNRV